MNVVRVPVNGQAHAGRGALRGIAGTLAVGLLVLAAVLIVVQLMASDLRVHGPGVGPIVAHLVAGLLALVGAVVADRGRGVVAGLAVLGVVVVTGVVLWLYWWA